MIVTNLLPFMLTGSYVTYAFLLLFVFALVFGLIGRRYR